MHLRLTTVCVLSLGACTTDPLPPELLSPEVPETIAVPEGHRVAVVGHATGVQIYECAGDNTAAQALAWRLRAPRADLIADDGHPIATHFGGIDVGSPAGPYWRSIEDGSSVHGGNPISAPNPGSIPFLRLDAIETGGSGIFSEVTFIHRLATEGGVGPTGGCATVNAQTEVPYASDYYFYVPL
jgi:hypothetical protein